LKTAKQGKDLKLALQCGDGSVWDNLRGNSVWLDLNHELKDVVYPPPETKAQVRRFMEPTLGLLTACPVVTIECRSQPKVRASFQRNQHTVRSASPTFVDMPNDEDDENESHPFQSKKCTHAQMAEDHQTFLSNLRFRGLHGRWSLQNALKLVRGAPAPNVGRDEVHSHLIRVTPLQSRQPFPDRDVTHDVSFDASTDGLHDVASALRKDRHAFYIQAASAMRVSVRMDTQKPTLRFPIQPHDLFYLIARGLLNFDFEHDEFQTFEAEIQK
jgi:hypothetical protein